MGMELLRGEAASRVVWSEAFLDRLCADTLMRYLAVAHFGRGAGEYRAREQPALWRVAVDRALAPRRPALHEAFAQARREGLGDPVRETALELGGPVGAALRAVLAELYPEASGTLGTRNAAPRGASESESGVVPR
jgi:hypothetical protein